MSDTVVESAGDAIVIVDSAGIIAGWNRAATELLGHPSADAIGQTLALIIPTEHRPRHIACFHRAIETRQLAHHGRPARVRALHADGTTRDLAMTLGISSDDDPQIIAILRTSTTPSIDFVANQSPAVAPTKD